MLFVERTVGALCRVIPPGLTWSGAAGAREFCGKQNPADETRATKPPPEQGRRVYEKSDPQGVAPRCRGEESAVRSRVGKFR